MIKILGFIGIAFVIIPLIIYIILLSKTKKKPKKDFAFLARDNDLKNFITYFYKPETINNDLIEQFKKEYPDYYDKIDKKFMDNYFKRV